MSNSDAIAPEADPDVRRLGELGYAQELKRGMGGFSNFAVSFSIISILAGGTTTYYLGMDAGGPLAITTGWLIVGFFTLLVGMSMAELTSAFPTAGGPYHWSAMLAKKHKAAWSWTTGWFNLIGQVAVTASIDFGLATFVGFLIHLYVESFTPTARWIFLVYAVILLVHGLLNTFGVSVVSIFADVSAWWHLGGVAVIVVVLMVVPSHHLGVSDLTTYYNNTGWTGPHVGIYVFMIGLLLAQYTIGGYDASAHLAEETHHAETAPSKAILRSIYVSVAAGFLLNLAMTLTLPAVGSAEYNKIASLTTTAGAQVLVHAVGGAGGKFLVIIATVAMFFAGLASVTANSRMIFAFARDGVVPFHGFFRALHVTTKTPVHAVWFAAVAALVLGVPSLFQHNGVSIAFFAAVSISTVGLYISYAIPIYLKIRNPDFVQGPWHLRGFSKIIGWITIVWVAVISVVFFVPQFWPFWGFANINNFNWAAPVFVLVLAIILLWWVLGAHRWFQGPIRQGPSDQPMPVDPQSVA
ncbi:MAG: amino acid permease [Actinomycetes bacterium]